MLCQLSIRNIAVIERTEITFDAGLNILTGETGAGKSIIIDSVNLILGERADKTLIRSGTENAYVEALFDISECPKVRKVLFDMFEDEDEELIISRELSARGRNICRINGRMATLLQLSAITRDLLDIHGQHEHQSLLNINNHIKVLDAFCGENLSIILSKYQIKFKEYNDLCEKIHILELNDLEKQEKLDILNFQYNEINDMNLVIGEDEQLRAKRDILIHSSKIKNSIQNSYNLFNGTNDSKGGILGRLENSKQELLIISDISQEFTKLSERINQMIIECDDIFSEIQDINMNTYLSDDDIDDIEGRISSINKLRRKYGTTIEEILINSSELKKQIEDINENEFRIEHLQKNKKILYDEVLNLAEIITDIRKKAALELSQNILNQLMHLGMEKSKFEVVFRSKTDDNNNLIFYNNGKDIVEFLIATNPGEPLKQLNKIASGGEMSRIMLALKTISSNADEISTLIFDEIDTGISGKMASTVAQKLAAISKQHQIICVTHTAQIAAMADVHNYIEKITDDLKAKTEVKLLYEDERYKEISRLVGGNNISQYSEKHAKEIIYWSKSFKNSLNL